MKIEHWNARSTARTTDKKSTFRWSNLLGVCLGDEAAEGGLKAGEQHCDTSKGNARLFLHPVEGQGPNPSEYLRYTHEGKVRPIADAADVAAAAQSDIEVLNLNARRLQRARQEIFDELRRRLERSNFSAASLNAEYRAATIRPGEKAVEQCEFVRYMVRRWARKNGYASPT